MQGWIDVLKNAGRALSFFLAIAVGKIILKIVAWNPFEKVIGLQHHTRGQSHFFLYLLFGCAGILLFDVIWRKLRPKDKQA